MMTISDLRFCWQNEESPQGDELDRLPGSGFELVIPSLVVADSTIAAVTGPSGCGKTTLLNLIAGILRPISGTIVVDSCDVCHMSEALRRDFRLRQIGMVFQDFQLINYLSVVENVLLPCRLSRKSTITAEQRTRATDLLASVGLADKSKRPVTRLSQGERQRVAICRALIRQPSLILADEPTGNLDPVNSRQILELLIRQARAVDATLLMVTHDHGQLDVFDRRIEMEQFFVGSQAASGEQCPC